ncbi:MAG: hypothetical protein EP335_05045 [Alphaproteobacteria bacterium]|nr:MAG: hypothetical protein EP335_05045 [Alphaproteobacteria bacterium]
MTKNIVFLHIPKTAGQSIHQKLEDTFGADKCAPVRVNGQMQDYSLKDLLPYQVFSGHIDWMALDFVPGPKVVFSILRDPRERLASFYLYLKDKAEKADPELLARPENRGMFLARNLSIDDYFTNMNIKERKFLDDHYDNFYTYFFAGRAYDARMKIRRHFGTDAAARAKIVDRAFDNCSAIDIIGDVSDLAGFSDRFREATGKDVDFAGHRINVNRALEDKKRFDAILALNPKKQTLDRIESFLEMDNELHARLMAR